MLAKELYFQVTLSSREEQEQEIYLRSLWEGHALFLKKNNLFVEFITLLDLDDCQRKRSTLLLRGIYCKPFISLPVVCSTYLFSLLVQALYWLIMVCLLHFLTLFCWELPCQPGGWIQAVQSLTPKGARPRSCAGGGCSLPQSTLHLKSQPAPELPLGLLCSPAAPPAAGRLSPVPLLAAIPTQILPANTASEVAVKRLRRRITLCWTQAGVKQGGHTAVSILIFDATKPSALGICSQLPQHVQTAAGAGAGALWDPDGLAGQQRGQQAVGRERGQGWQPPSPWERSPAAVSEVLCSALLLFRAQMQRETTAGWLIIYFLPFSLHPPFLAMKLPRIQVK